MSQMMIENGMVVDEVANMLIAIQSNSGITVKDAAVVKKFIQNEICTKFYINEKFNTDVDERCGYYYLWLDTGFRDFYGKPLFVALVKQYDGTYKGHYTGTAKELMKLISVRNKKNKRVISENYSKFLNKYQERTKERVHPYIVDEDQYLLAVLNGDMADTEMATQLMALGLAFEPEEEVVEEEKIVEVEEERFTREQENITIDILFDELERRDAYVQELLEIIATSKASSEEKITELKEQNAEYMRVIHQFRDFTKEQKMEEMERENARAEAEKWKIGHKVLNRNRKILVIGDAAISQKDMIGIAKNEFGFEKSDFEFEIDYKKVVAAGRRIVNSGRYDAIIFGPTPHKVAGMGVGASFVDNCKAMFKDVLSVNAVAECGGLKITKASFRTALRTICTNLGEMMAS